MQAIIQFVLPFSNNYYALLILGGVFGIIQAPYNMGLSVILGEMVPMKKIASAFAKMALFQGIGSIIGPSIGGLIYDATNDIKLLYFIAASINVLGGIASGSSTFIFCRNKMKYWSSKYHNVHSYWHLRWH